jgi:hypothetical protein
VDILVPTTADEVSVFLTINPATQHHIPDGLNPQQRCCFAWLHIIIHVKKLHSATCGLLQSVSLGPELYLAPEMMYTSLGLPQAILDVTNGLPVNILKECLCHILLTGTVHKFNLSNSSAVWLMWPCSIPLVNTDIVFVLLTVHCSVWVY